MEAKRALTPEEARRIADERGLDLAREPFDFVKAAYDRGQDAVLLAPTRRRWIRSSASRRNSEP